MDDDLHETQAKGSTADFVSALCTGQPIVGQMLEAISSGDEQKMDDFVTNCGYDVTVDGTQAVVKSLNAGPDFDIRLAGGIYSFTKPSDLSLYSMVIDSATGSLSIGNAQEQATVNRIIENGIVKFEYGSYHYEISWATVELDEKGSPKPRNFSGFRKLSSDTGNSSQEDIAGEEIVDAEEKSKVLEWFASLTATTSCWILTALGFVVTVGLWIFDKARAHQSEKLSNVVKKAREELEDARKLFRADAEKATSKMFNDMPLREYREAIEEAVRTAVRDYQDPEDAVIKLVGDAAIDFIQPQLVDLGGSLTYYERIVGPQFMANELLERELPRAIKSASSKLSPSRITRGYINALKVAEEQSRIMQQRTDQLEKLRPQEIQLAQAKDAAEQELRIKQRALENYLAEKHDEEDSVSKDYREAIEEQERALKKATETADIFHEAARRAEEQREEAERRHIQEHDRADREAEKIFRE